MIALISSNFRANGKRRKKSERFANNVIQVEVFQFKRCFFQQAAHPPDDFAGAPVILHDIIHNIFEFNDVGESSDVRALRFQNCLCGFGIGQNSTQAAG